MARERLDTHVSTDTDSWKLTRYGTMFPWIQVINKHFLGYEMEDIFSVGPSQQEPVVVQN
jgi:hypothetical protein